MSSNDQRNLEPGEQYGYTYNLNASGDLDTNQLHRPREIYDEQAVKQDLKVALATPKGTDPFRPEYGLDQFEAIGTSDARLRQEIIRVIGPRTGPPGSGQGDPRVERVEVVEIDRPPGDRENTTVFIRIALRDGTVTSFEFPIARLRSYDYEMGERSTAAGIGSSGDSGGRS